MNGTMTLGNSTTDNYTFLKHLFYEGQTKVYHFKQFKNKYYIFITETLKAYYIW